MQNKKNRNLSFEMVPKLHGFGLQSTPLVVVRKGKMDPNGYGVISRYTVGKWCGKCGNNGESCRNLMNE